MPWVFANTSEVYTGEVHEIGRVTYSGKTRTPESRRLVWADEVEAARTADGKFVADDPSTPLVNESKRGRRKQ